MSRSKGGVYNIIFKRGATYNLSLTYRDNFGGSIDLTGSSFAMEIRKDHGEPVIEDLSPYITSEDPQSGILEISVPADVTNSFVFERAKYDLLIIYSDKTVERVLQGTCFVSDKITEVEYV